MLPPIIQELSSAAILHRQLKTSALEGLERTRVRGNKVQFSHILQLCKLELVQSCMVVSALVDVITRSPAEIC